MLWKTIQAFEAEWNMERKHLFCFFYIFLELFCGKYSHFAVLVTIR